MFKVPFAGRRAVALVALSLSAAPAAALTGEDVMEKMGKDERNGYLAGAVEMAAFMNHADGRRERAQCVLDLFFGDDADPLLFDKTLSEFKDRQAMPVIHLVIRRECGE
ncbi:MAG: hypothetical protein NXH88_17755 [Hyphomonas sp.]|nr:hypothetical protein [Hyphomonas sp.]